MNDVLLSVGSNINPELNFRRSIALLRRDRIFVDATAPIFTKPVGYQFQPDFLNAAFYVRTPLERDPFNRTLKAIEFQLGRVKTAIKSGPRTIDLDIIVWNGRIVRDEFYEYDYVSGPIRELAARHGTILQAAPARFPLGV